MYILYMIRQKCKKNRQIKQKDLHKSIDLQKCKIYNNLQKRKKGGNELTNTTELKVELVRKGLTYEKLADAIGINPCTFYRKAKGESEFTRNELLIIKQLLELSDKRFIEIFFA